MAGQENNLSGRWPTVTGMDINALQERLDGDRELFNELFGMFIVELQAATIKAAQLKRDSNNEDLKFLMHKVRSQATTLSANAITHASAKVEEAIKTGDVIDENFALWQRTVSEFIAQTQDLTQ
jgi:HPt (histidine-containing phosphotransfer) domain-containing protein